MKVMNYLKTYEPNIWFWKVADNFTSGLPDIVGAYKGKFFAIELKSPGEKPRKLQYWNLWKIKKAKGKTAVCESLEEVHEFIENVVLKCK